jgi:Uma2 family endonuclease
MSQHLEQEIEHYYDWHPLEEEEMAVTSFHADLVTYLAAILRWHFRQHVCSIHENLNFYQSRDYMERPLAPDIAVNKGIPYTGRRSWIIGLTGGPPQVVFEILSSDTWSKDVDEKPLRYARMGVEEYFAYDPNEPPLAAETTQRLFGWRLDRPQGQMVRLPLDAQGRLWSQQLDCWLVPDGTLLRLVDNQQQVWLTEAEAQAQRADLEAIARQAETSRADAEARRAAALAEKLRSLGINPDEL